MQILYITFWLLLFCTMAVFLKCFVHEMIYEDNSYIKPFELLGFLWGVFIFVCLLKGGFCDFFI